MISKLRPFLYALPLLGITLSLSGEGCPKPHSGSDCSSSSCTEKCTWGLDPTFNGCSKTPGINVFSTSPFLDISQSIAIDDCCGDCCKDRYLIAGDSVNLPNYCSGAVDGHIDERVTAVQAFRHDGTRDTTFAQNGVLRFYNSIFGNFNANVLIKCNNGCQNVFVVGNTQVQPSGAYDDASVGNCDNQATCGFSYYRGPKDTPYFLGSRPFLARFQCDGEDTDPCNCYQSNCNGNAVSTFGPDPLAPCSGQGSVVNKAVWHTPSKSCIVTAGYNTPGLDGCGFSNPEIFKLTVADGCVQFDTITPVTSFVDCVPSTSEPFGYGQYESVTTFTTGGVTSIYAVGDANVQTADDFWPFNARGIVAKYDGTTGALDTNFGTVTISKEGKQILLRSIVTDGNFIYLGGDIADSGSGTPGALTASGIGQAGQLISRLSANFLIIKLNMDGTPFSIDANNNFNTVELKWNNGNTQNCQCFNAIQTDFFAGDDACFALAIDWDRLVAAGYASTGPSLEEQRPVVVRYLINHDLNLDHSFNDGFVLLKDISPFRALARDLVISVNMDCHKRYLITGQAANGPAAEEPAFSDATQTNMFIAALAREEDDK